MYPVRVRNFVLKTQQRVVIISFCNTSLRLIILVRCKYLLLDRDARVLKERGRVNRDTFQSIIFTLSDPRDLMVPIAETSAL